VWGDSPPAVVLAEPRVSWINLPKPALPRSGATLPESANGLSRIQHGYRTTRRAERTVPQARWHFNKAGSLLRCPSQIARKGPAEVEETEAARRRHGTSPQGLGLARAGSLNAPIRSDAASQAESRCLVTSDIAANDVTPASSSGRDGFQVEVPRPLQPDGAGRSVDADQRCRARRLAPSRARQRPFGREGVPFARAQ